MALKVEVKHIESLKQRGEKYLKLHFRGTSFKTQIFSQTDHFVFINESYEWPLTRALKSRDILTIKLVNQSRFLTNKVIDVGQISLEEVVENGVHDTEVLLNDNKTKIQLNLIYSPTNAKSESPPQEVIVDIEETSDSQQLLNSDHSTSEEVAFVPKIDFSEETVTNTIGEMVKPESTSLSIERPNSDNASLLFENEDGDTNEAADPVPIKTPVLISKLNESFDANRVSVKSQTTSVCVKIIEGRQLVGLNIDPVVCIEVGDKKKNTAVKESTNSPYYNEYFVFTFREPAAKVLDKLITITCLHSKNVLQSDEAIGTFKLDVGTVFAQSEHQFVNKWAPLSDPLSGDTKGYIKCDISVVTNRDSKKESKKATEPETKAEDDDIESNLLLPEGVFERALVKLNVKIFRASGLPRCDSGVGAALKKAFTAGTKEMINPYVVVSFAGLKGKTSVCKKSCNPTWNEQVSFTEMFPPLFQKIKIQIYDSSTGTDDVIATHYIPISKISNNGDDGFLPTFGPSYINFYGAPRDSNDDDFIDLNNGLQEGVAFRGKLLMAISTDIIESVDFEKEKVSVKQIPALEDKCLGNEQEYILFGALFDSNMIDNKYSDKQISYELSIGDPDDIDGDGVITEEDKKALKNYKGISAQYKPLKANTNYGKDTSYCLQFGEEKPSVFVKHTNVDAKRRLYSSNIVSSIATNFETGLRDVEMMCDCEHSDSQRRLLGVIQQFIEDWRKFIDSAENDGGNEHKTKLDKELSRFNREVFDAILQTADAMKPLVFKSPVDEIIDVCFDMLEKLRNVEDDIQSSIPDIIITMLANGKRVAFTKLSAKNYIFSSKIQEKGKYCGSIKTYFLYSPSKSSFKLRNKIDAYIWFGATDDKKYFAEGLIRGYKNDILNEGKDPPNIVPYHERHQLQFRAHMFQARSLIASDSSGLSDPYAKIYFLNSCLVTQVIEETLSPTWDELLVSPPVTVYGNRFDLLNIDLNVVIEFYDKDTVGDDEYIGRAISKCILRFADQPYSVPQLEWIDIFRDGEPGGQLLACFELIQLADSDIINEYPKALPTPRSLKGNKSAIPIPISIKPILSQYRLSVIFWGLRDLKKVQMMSIDRPRVDIECGGRVISSNVITNYKKNPNFIKPLKYIDLELPDQQFYCPPIVISVVDCRAFGRNALVGTHIIKSVSKFISKKEKSLLLRANVDETEIIVNCGVASIATDVHLLPNSNSVEKGAVVLDIEKEKTKQKEDEDIDWWTKYYSSKSIARRGSLSSDSSFDAQQSVELSRSKLPKSQLFAIYSCELEKASKYKSASKRLYTYDLFRGKQKTSKGKDKLKVGKFKGAINLSKFPIPKVDPFELISSNEPTRVFVRCYLVRAFDVKPKDIGGKADLYPVIKVGKQRISDRENYIPNQLNPLFGRCYEFQATLPFESVLTVSLKDRDMIGSDDLIGLTKIDLEDRFYSFSRSTCGLQKAYETQGFNAWRDSQKPSQILASLCKELKLPLPVVSSDCIRIGKVAFKRNSLAAADRNNEEQFCLDVLHSWKKAFGYRLVEEHLETRNLYNPEKPGLCQGKLEMWVDLFPMDKPIPAAVEITPRKPIYYELRVIIWNTEDVVLDDDSVVSGEKMSDIYVKGWLTEAKEAQSTDIHYRSLTGEGNFNWRFIFPFAYLPSEDKVVVTKKGSLFSVDSTEVKIPPNFNLQIWDADNFSGDDFLGSIIFDLNSVPRGAKTSKTCSVDLLKEESNNPKVSLFKVKRLRGWWPALAKADDGEVTLAGKIDAEFQLLTGEEAEQSPAGLGRKEPDPLDPPNRPETSFLWFMSPFKSFKHILWSKNKGKLLKLLLLLLFVYFIIMFIYSVPGYTVKRIIGA